MFDKIRKACCHVGVLLWSSKIPPLEADEKYEHVYVPWFLLDFDETLLCSGFVAITDMFKRTMFCESLWDENPEWMHEMHEQQNNLLCPPHWSLGSSYILKRISHICQCCENILHKYTRRPFKKKPTKSLQCGPVLVISWVITPLIVVKSPHLPMYIAIYRSYPPQKSNIDTKTGHIWSRTHLFPNHYFEYPAASFWGMYKTITRLEGPHLLDDLSKKTQNRQPQVFAAKCRQGSSTIETRYQGPFFWNERFFRTVYQWNCGKKKSVRWNWCRFQVFFVVGLCLLFLMGSM